MKASKPPEQVVISLIDAIGDYIDLLEYMLAAHSSDATTVERRAVRNEMRMWNAVCKKLDEWELLPGLPEYLGYRKRKRTRRRVQ